MTWRIIGVAGALVAAILFPCRLRSRRSAEPWLTLDVLSTANITMQFGAKPLFENISVKFGDGNRYGLIGANGCGKSTFMKILGGDLEPSAGNVALDVNERLGKLRQDQFAYEEMRVLDVVMMGHTEMWAAMQERDAIYANPDATDDDYMRAADLEGKVSEYDGYTAESRAGELLLGAGVDISLHQGPMSAVSPGWKLRVLLAQALFSNPDILLLDEPTNNLDINTIRWLEDVLNERNSTMIIISHDRHFLNQVCTHVADMDYGTLKIYPGNYDEYMLTSTQARNQQLANNAKAKEKVAELQDFVRRFSANKSKARQATSRAKMIEKIKVEDMKPSSRAYPFVRFDGEKKLHRLAVEAENISKAYDQITGLNADTGRIKWAENANVGYMPQDPTEEFATDLTLTDWMGRWTKEGDDDQAVRSSLGRLLFGGDEVKKSVRVLSGGEKGRMMYGKL
eukprot:gene33464-41291_t